MHYYAVWHYLSCPKDLLLTEINYTKSFANISGNKTTIMHTRKPLLFSGTDVWIKKDGDKGFDVTMASFDEAEICEVLLHKLGEKYGKK